MKHLSKRCLAVLLAVVMTFSLLMPSFAQTVPDSAADTGGGSVSEAVEPDAEPSGPVKARGNLYSTLMSSRAVQPYQVYVARLGTTPGPNVGNDTKGNGTFDLPYATIKHALEVINAAGVDSAEIILKTDIPVASVMELSTSGSSSYPPVKCPITFKSSGGNYSIVFSNASSDLGNDQGIVTVQGSNVDVTFEGVGIRNDTDRSARCLYVSQEATVTLVRSTLEDGKILNATQFDHGGAAIMATDKANVTVTDCELKDNEVTVGGVGGGGAIMVKDGAYVLVNGATSIHWNQAPYGGGIYVRKDSTVELHDSVLITDNKVQGGASDHGVGLYVETNANVIVGGSTDSVIIDNAKSYSTEHNWSFTSGNDNHYGVFLEQSAELGKMAYMTIVGNTQKCRFMIDCDDENEVAYRLIALPGNGYTIKENEANGLIVKYGDEAGWIDDCDTWDIRYMAYANPVGYTNPNPGQKVPALYLCYKTISVTFEGTQSMITVKGMDIDGDIKDYLNDDMAAVSIRNEDVLRDDDGDLVRHLYVTDVVMQNEEGDDYTFTLNCKPLSVNDANNTCEGYRIPTPDIVTVTVAGEDLVYDKDYTGIPGTFGYTYDVDKGEAQITIPIEDIMNAGNDGICIDANADKYYSMVLKMAGPLYIMSSDGVVDNRLSEKIAVWTEESRSGTTALHRVMRDGQPLAGVSVQMYDSATKEPYGKAVLTDADGYARFEGLEANGAYFPVLTYEKLYCVVGRDVFDLDLSCLEGQSLAVEGNPTVNVIDSTKNPVAGNPVITFDASTGDSNISKVYKDVVIMYNIQMDDVVISFDANEGDATTKPASVDFTSKSINKNSDTYGPLPGASMVGYDFLGWFTEPEGGEQVTASTAFENGVSATYLYAHWAKRNDIAYTIQHWVEYDATGANAGYRGAAHETKEYNGKTYYLYETTKHVNGTADTVKTDFDGYDLQDEETIYGDITFLSGNKNFDHIGNKLLTWWTRKGFSSAIQDEDCFVLADGSSVFGMFYDRNTYTVSFEVPGAGTVLPTTPEFDPQPVKFGSQYGQLPEAEMPGYEFGGWYDETGNRVNPDTIYTHAGDQTLTAHWNSREDVCYAIYVMLSDIEECRDPSHEHIGKWHETGNYTRSKVVYLDNSGNLLKGQADTTLSFNISSINELSISGFHYVGYNSVNSPNGMTDGTGGKASVYIKPTDASTEAYGKYNPNFNGGIVYLFYERDTLPITITDGQGVVTEDEIIFGGNFVKHLPDEDPKKDGYDFVNWIDNDGNVILPGTSADDYVLAGVPQDIQATWTPRKYNLTYIPGAGASYIAQPGTLASAVKPVANGGYVDPNQITYDKPIGEMPTASKPGYNFLGWQLYGDDVYITENTVATVDNVIISNAPAYTPESTRPLYGSFRPHTYVLQFDPGEKNGIPGKVGVSSVDVVFDQKVPTLPTPTLTGYRFVGWQIDPNDPSSTVYTGQVWTKPYGDDGHVITLHAVWVPNTYHYRFNLNDTIGSTRGALVDVSIDYGDVTYDSMYGEVMEVEARRSGYTFKGWSLVRDGAVLTPDDINTIASDVELYAIWEPKNYPVKLVLNGGDIGDLSDNTKPEFDPTASYDAATDTWTIQVAFDSTYGDLPVAVRDKCIFGGWEVYAPHWIAIHGTVIDSLPTYVDYEDAETILYAIMTPIFTFDPDGGQFVDNGGYTPRDVPQTDIGDMPYLPEVKKDGYTYKEWQDPNGNRVTKDDLLNMKDPITLTPIFVPNLTFDPNGGTFAADGSTGPKVVTKYDITMTPTVTRKGWTFMGWVDEDGNPFTDDDIAAAEKPMTIIALWKANVTLDPNGGQFDDGGMDEKDFPGNTFDQFPDVTRPGYEFDGWYDKDGNLVVNPDGTPVDPSIFENLDEPMTIVAKWTANITFDANGGTVDGVASITRRLDSDEAVPVAKKATSGNTKYTFKGWFTEKTGGTEIDIDALREANEPVTVYAQYKSDTTGGGWDPGVIPSPNPTPTPTPPVNPGPVYPVNPNPGGNDTDVDIEDPNTPLGNPITATFENSDVPEQIVMPGDKVIKPEDPERDGFDFAGWFADPDCTIPFDFDTIPEDDVIIYGKWEIKETPANSWFTDDHIAYIMGYDTGLVGPNNNLTRAEAAMIFYRLLKPEIREEYYMANSYFFDVPAGAWYAEAVATLARMDILTGVGGNNYNPNAPITRAEFATICARFDPTEVETEIEFVDVPTDHWAYAYIQSAAAKGWVQGYGDGQFGPSDNIRRCEAVTLINRVLGRDTITSAGMLPGMTMWPDNMDQDAWYFEAMQEATNGHAYNVGGDSHEYWTDLHIG